MERTEKHSTRGKKVNFRAATLARKRERKASGKGWKRRPKRWRKTTQTTMCCPLTVAVALSASLPRSIFTAPCAWWTSERFFSPSSRWRSQLKDLKIFADASVGWGGRKKLLSQNHAVQGAPTHTHLSPRKLLTKRRSLDKLLNIHKQNHKQMTWNLPAKGFFGFVSLLFSIRARETLAKLVQLSNATAMKISIESREQED